MPRIVRMLGVNTPENVPSRAQLGGADADGQNVRRRSLEGRMIMGMRGIVPLRKPLAKRNGGLDSMLIGFNCEEHKTDNHDQSAIAVAFRF